MSFLLVPQDERELTAYLCGEIGAHLLLSDLAPSGIAQLADEPLQALPADLPARPRPGSQEVHELLFWLPQHGAIRTMRDAPEAVDPRDVVARRLTWEASDRFPDVIDVERTPLLRLHRSTRLTDHRLGPGTLALTRLDPPELAERTARTHAQVVRWLKRHGTRTDPFQHCPEVADRRPVNLGPLAVWVQPHADVLVRQGMEIWPWSGG